MKLMPFTIFILGICISAIILSVAYFNFYDPNTAEAGFYNSDAEARETIGAQLGAQKKKYQEAVALRKQASADWQEIVAVKTPPASKREGGIDLAVNRYQLTRDAIDFRDRIQVALNRQMRRGGITVLSGPTVPNFPDNPQTIVEQGFNYLAYGFPVRIYDFGTMRVRGTRAQIEQHIEAWSDMPNYLAVTDGLVYEGTSSILEASYQLTVVMFIRAEAIFPPVPAGAPVDPNAPGGNTAPGAPNFPASPEGGGGPQPGSFPGRGERES